MDVTDAFGDPVLHVCSEPVTAEADPYQGFSKEPLPGLPPHAGPGSPVGDNGNTLSMTRTNKPKQKERPAWSLGCRRDWQLMGGAAHRAPAAGGPRASGPADGGPQLGW